MAPRFPCQTQITLASANATTRGCTGSPCGSVISSVPQPRRGEAQFLPLLVTFPLFTHLLKEPADENWESITIEPVSPIITRVVLPPHEYIEALDVLAVLDGSSANNVAVFISPEQYG